MSDDRERRNTGTAMAVGAVLFGMVTTLVLVAIAVPGILFVVLAVAVLGVVGIVQYALWGWRLDARRISQDDDAAAEPKDLRRK